MNFYIIDFMGLQKTLVRQSLVLYSQFPSYYYLYINISMLVITLISIKFKYQLLCMYVKSFTEY